jgi:predicted glycosyltransferase
VTLAVFNTFKMVETSVRDSSSMLVAMRAHPSLTLYCHDSLGLGHMRRAYLLVEHLRAHWLDMPQLIISGLSLSEPFFYAEWADYIKLPTAFLVGGEQRLVSRRLPIASEELQAMRRDILLSIVRHFQPDVLLVDHTPAGLQAELLPSLQYLKDQSPRTRLILGLRDIVEGDRAFGVSGLGMVSMSCSIGSMTAS